MVKVLDFAHHPKWLDGTDVSNVTHQSTYSYTPAWCSCELDIGMVGDLTCSSIRSLISDEGLSDDSSPCELASFSSESLVCGRLITSSSDSSLGQGGALWMFWAQWYDPSASWRREHVGTHMIGSWPWSCWSLQWSSKQKISLIWICDGSFYSKSSGIHASVIHDIGSLTSVPHGMACFLLPLQKPCADILDILPIDARSTHKYVQCSSLWALPVQS